MLIEWTNFLDGGDGDDVRNLLNSFNTSVKENVDNLFTEQERIKASSEISYDNTFSGLTATEVKSALDEINTKATSATNESHTHTNKSTIDTINQELSTTSDVSFNSISLVNPIATVEIVSTITADSILNGETVVLANTTSNNITITLPDATSGKKNYIKKIVGINDLTIVTNDAGLIEGNINMIITDQNASVTLVSDGINWYII